eukprot:CAMPEP_0179839886 /NCGR_PEP_ID=MMETSP0982-20121206/1588_1 /TAXON_ID=483367 /ORGANISM="non described non described, Strain CCMP 2436" /LENGTH=86 /DNA_ID=CAMNT_0021723633 /DNA_START=101 /DNA_END=362 /DNA_ORIENTATION=+
MTADVSVRCATPLAVRQAAHVRHGVVCKRGRGDAHFARLNLVVPIPTLEHRHYPAIAHLVRHGHKLFRQPREITCFKIQPLAVAVV